MWRGALPGQLPRCMLQEVEAQLKKVHVVHSIGQMDSGAIPFVLLTYCEEMKMGRVRDNLDEHEDQVRSMCPWCAACKTSEPE